MTEEINNLRPTDEQQMEQEAEALCKKYKLLFTGRVLAALTEFGKMWKERGREEMEQHLKVSNDKLDFHYSESIKLQQQLAEKDKKIAHALVCMNEFQDESNRRLIELNAAKAEIEKLKQWDREI